jgi:pantothenate kinase
MEPAVMSSVTPAQLLQTIDQAAMQGGRTLIGIAGAPGAGKSTLAAWLQGQRPLLCVVVPMDGFHLAQSVLQALGRSDRKGAPDTFDALGYVALLERLRVQREGDGTVWAPAFDRTLEQPVAGSIGVAAGVPVVITEGNYLLLDEAPWRGVSMLLDACWYVDTHHELRRQRLLDRHVRHGRSVEQARAWIQQVDEPNAQRIERSKHRASRLVQDTQWS